MLTWSNLLQTIIKSNSERQRLAISLGISPVTLSRWANGGTRPQRLHLIQLIQAIHPEYRQELLDALEVDYPDIQTWLTKDSSQQILPEFFAHVLHIRTITTDSLRFWRMSEVILKQALAQLDPNQLGMSVRLLQCMPPWSTDNKVHSLRERAGKGTPPWTADLEHEAGFLGVESLSGYAVETRRSMKDDNVRKQNKPYPVVQDEFEVSAAAYPIRLEGRVAGCFLATSTQEAYFSQQRLSLMTTFSNLLFLAFEKDDFYSVDQIQLGVMPHPDKQHPILTQFRQRVTAKLQDALYKQQHMRNSEIELLTWQEFESELLKLAALS